MHLTNPTFLPVTGRWPVVAILALLSACGSDELVLLKTDGTEQDADKLMIVDCLLPGQIKRLGVGSTYVTPRRPAKLTALDCENRGGEYVAYEQANSASALKVWLPSAQEGNMVAQTYVGEIYEKGFGIESDYKTAAAWYKKAADQGYARAKLNLGYLYEKGLGVTQDVKFALELYRQASGLSDTDMQFESTIASETIKATIGDIVNLKTGLNKEQEQLAAQSEDLQEQQQRLQSEKDRLTQETRDLRRQKRLLAKQKRLTDADKHKLKALESKLVIKEMELNRRLAQTDEAPPQTSDIPSTAVTPLQLAKVSIAGPSIQLVNPQLVSMRGISVVNVRPGTKTREIIGNINAPAGLKTLSINDKQHPISEKGLFKVLLPVSAERKPIKIVAIDRQGKRAKIEFDLVQSDTPRMVKTGFNKKETQEVSGNLGNFHALVIGNNNYTQYPTLKTAINDAKSVAAVLSNKYGFRTTTLVNANRFMILAALNRLSKKLTEKDNLLVYYAGHGELANNETAGFWLPVDADRSNKRKWIPNSAISDVISSMPVKRVLVVADSCYSGSLTRSSLAQMDDNASSSERLTWLRAMAKSKARLALTSGGLKPVSDEGSNNHSLFANALLNILNDNNDILEGQRLYNLLFAKVSIGAETLNVNQEPLYAPIRHAGHESGEFFFLPKQS
ncbi:MAG: caspase family protein [Gammaproteobacteria bacterium]|nr:caspase family protein [Gammaproteobacteria bacterium]MDH5802423.1 caspase family protein [Gammaproteobacteria bacterium]